MFNSKNPKQITEQQALLKLTTLCTQAEHCSQEMLDKMKKWQLSEEAIARNMEFLSQKKFVDDERFARFFINDKIKYNKWGRRKVEAALWQKGISSDIYAPVLDAVDREQYVDTLLPLLKAKQRTVTGRTAYERHYKLLRYAIGRGFDVELAKQCLDQIEKDNDDDSTAEDEPFDSGYDF